MALFQNMYDSLFGDLESQARNKDDQAFKYLDTLEGVAGQEFLAPNATAVDPTGRNAQMQALQRMQGIADAGGLTAMDRARLDDVNRQAAQQEQSQRGAIMQNAAQRGALGSGATLAAQMAAQQGSASRRAQGGLQTAAMAQQRALDAISQTGQMGQNLRGQDMQTSAAQDAINRFNASQRGDAVNRRLGVGGMRYGGMQGQAKALRDRQREGEESWGSLADTASKFIPLPK